MALHQPRPFSFPASPPTSHGHMYDDTSSKSPPSSPGVTVRRKAFVLSSIATNASVVGGSPTHAPARKMPPPLLRSNTEVLFTSTLPVAKEAAPRPKRKTGLLDWIRVCRSGKDLTSVGGVKLTVTEEELAKHNTPEDAWTAIRGKVYNITPYIQFHPGGADTLLQGAGKDCTLLFDEAHKNVKVESMLSKCLVGTLAPAERLTAENVVRRTREASPARAPGHQTDLSEQRTSRSSQAAKASDEPDAVTLVSPESPCRPMLSELGSTRSRLSTVQPDRGEDSAISLQVPPTRARKISDTARPHPRFDWIESEKSIIIRVVTQCNTLKNSDVVVDVDGRKFEAVIFISEWVYQLSIDLSHGIKSSRVVINEQRVEITLRKEKTSEMWGTIGTLRPDHGQLALKSKRDRKYRLSKVEEISSVTHDTKLFTIRLPAGSHLLVPTGHHVAIRATIDGKVVERSYTPVLPLNNVKSAPEGETIQFMIKLYKDGAMSKFLSELEVGDTVCVSDAEGSFDAGKLKSTTQVALIAAGTGVTPMVKVLNQLCQRDGAPAGEARSVKLLFANKKEKDVLWREELDAMSLSHKCFEIVNVLSAAGNSWKGQRGRIDGSLLKHHLPSSTTLLTVDKFLVCVCGPTPFTTGITNALLDMEVPDDCIHCFT